MSLRMYNKYLFLCFHATKIISFSWLHNIFTIVVNETIFLWNFIEKKNG